MFDIDEKRGHNEPVTVSIPAFFPLFKFRSSSSFRFNNFPFHLAGIVHFQWPRLVPRKYGSRCWYTAYSE